MSAPQHVPALDATARQLMQALGKYDADACRMVDTWPDIELYRSVSEQLEAIRIYSASLPQVRVQWTALLVAHAELIHMLWRIQYGHQASARAQIGPVRQHHGDCVAALHDRCARLLAGRAGGTGLQAER